VEACVRQAIRRLERLGARAEEVSLPCAAFAPAVQYATICAEATAYHRRLLRERSGDYGRDVLLRLAEGLFITAAGYLDAQRARRLVRAQVLAVLARVDALVTPTVPMPAPPLEAGSIDVGGVVAPPQHFMVRNTFLFNLAGLPAVSVPCGTVERLPVGLQVAGRPWEEETVLRVARAVETEAPRALHQADVPLESARAGG
jgi:aspartyl-tRNA(Asn)/glutamyl-tRNA(Gln) amidotransferase subunit A